MNNSRLIKIAALVLVLFAVAAWPTAAADTGRAECLSLKSKILGKQVPYCTLLPPSYDADTTRRYPILYFLHGLGDNEQSFVRSGGWNLTEDLWERHRLSRIPDRNSGRRSQFLHQFPRWPHALRGFPAAGIHTLHRASLQNRGQSP